MPLLTSQNIEAELSYAYLHAVAAHAGMSCDVAGRHLDNAGVDAEVSAREQFDANSVLTEITMHVQLKATTKRPADDGERLSYFMSDLARYDKLRKGRSIPQRILVVLFLPPSPADWLGFKEEQLVLQRCAYWASLVGAPESDNETGQTVYLPKSQVCSPEGLKQLMTRLSHLEELHYER